MEETKVKQMERLRRYVANLRGLSYAHAQINVMAAVIYDLEEAVKKNFTTWEELGITPEEVKSLANQTQIAKLKQHLEYLRTGCYRNQWEKDEVVKELFDAVENGIARWVELGTTPEELGSFQKAA